MDRFTIVWFPSQGSIALGTANEKLDIVQFASAIFVAEEGQDLGPKLADEPRNFPIVV